mgnify:FL=1|tara:strand:+ start:26961 stop:27614 length:654 start_codon:yes stop_codon:yes gene_type:complete
MATKQKTTPKAPIKTTTEITTKAAPKAAAKSAAKVTPKVVQPTAAAPMPPKAVETAVKNGKDAVDTAVKTSTEVAKKGVEKASAMSQDQLAAVAKASSDSFKSYGDMIEFQKSNIDAFVKSNEIMTKGVRELNKSFFAMIQANVEQTITTTQKIMGCASIAEAVELQTDVIKTQYMKTVDESRKLSTLSAKVAEQASKPLAERVTVAVETLAKPIAA